MQYSIDIEKYNSMINKKIYGSFLYMALGLAITTISFFLSLKFIEYTYNFIIPALIIQLVVTFIFSFSVYKVNVTVLKTLFLSYAALTGLSLVSIGFIYDLSSVLFILFSTIALFTILATYGYFTKSDLSSYGTYLGAGLLALMVTVIINIFLKSSALDTAISLFAVILFTILIAYDTQRIKNDILVLSVSQEMDLINRVEIVGAFSLYLDFINLFLYLLRLFGKKRN